jgi:superfamily II DNA or RNA helicase
VSVIVLRSIQEHAIARVRDAFKTARAILLQAVTGYGKTLTACAIAKGALHKRNRVLFLAHQDILIRQMSNKLRDFQVPHGIIMAGFTPDPHAHVQVASIQTMMRRIRKFRYEFELIIIDEAHRSVSQGYRDVLAAIPDARILGITGTPQRLDGRGLGAHAGGIYDTLITTESVAEMIELGYLVRPIYYASKDKLDLSKVKMRAGDYDETALASIVDTPVITGSAVSHYQELAAGLPALSWCINIAHAEHTAAQFNAAGIPSIVLTGKSTAAEREAGLDQLARRKVLNICFAQLLVEGVDVPAIGALIMLRPTKSLTAYLQVCGRGLRTDPANAQKRACIILDHSGLAFTHGLCNEHREWTLDGRAKKKKKVRDSLTLLQCRNCFLIFDVKDLTEENRCPKCHHEMKRPRSGPETVDGKLTEITADLALQLRRARMREVDACETLEDFKRIGVQRGYHRNWAHIQFGFKERARERARERRARPDPTEQPPLF